MPVDLLLLLGRIFIGGYFVIAGWQTLGNIAGSAGYFGSLGFPLPTLVAWGTGFFETIAGLAVLAGLQARVAAVLLAFFSATAGFIGHYGQGADAAMAFMHSQALMKDFAIAGGFLMLAAAGSGRFSADALLRQGAR